MRRTNRTKRRNPSDASKKKFEAKLDRIVHDFASRTRARSPPARSKPTQATQARSKPAPAKLAFRDVRTLKEATQEFQRGFVFEALQQHAVRTRWNIQDTARRLKISRSHLYLLIEELGLEQMRADRIRAERSIEHIGR